MSVCNFTQLVTPNTCLGDSLATFNANFSALDEGLCGIPNIVPGLGTSVEIEVSEQIHPTVRISTRNSFVYNTKFDYKLSATSDYILLSDNTTAPVTTFPYVCSISVAEPLATFSTISLTDSTPRVTLFWTASGASNTTVYATNSSSSTLNNGQISFNGPVTALLSSGDILYVGGEFTTVGGVDCKKFCSINLNGGSSYSNLETVGTLMGNPLSAYGDLGLEGTIQAIAEYGSLLIVAGSFQSLKKGRGLTILDRSNGNVYPFYVNGNVNDLLVSGDSLYVGGFFDYINYTAQGASIVSGLRVYANGLTKISLSRLITFPTTAIDKSFTTTAASLFNDLASINCFAVKGSTIYVGGDFDIRSGSYSTAKGIAILNANGSLNTSWKPLIGGEVFTLAVDGDYLYVGGAIKSFHTHNQFYSAPRTDDISTKAYNAICFRVTTPVSPFFESNWKPVFDGPVTKFAFHHSSFNSYVYCYGSFAQVNGANVNHLAAIEKSYNNLFNGKSIEWGVDLPSGPRLINQGILRYQDSVIVGGTFTKVREQNRFFLARISGAGESLLTNSLSSVVWDLGIKACSPGTRLGMDFTDFVRVSTSPGPYGTLNQTSFPIKLDASKIYSEGTLLKVFVRRPRALSTFSYPAYVIGWKVDFN